MKIVTSRAFNASPAILWEIIRDPGNMPAWNPKCVECSNVDAPTVGSRFSCAFEMSGKRSTAEGETLVFEYNRKLRIRYHYEEEARLGSVDEEYSLTEREMGVTVIKHIVDFKLLLKKNDLALRRRSRIGWSLSAQALQSFGSVPRVRVLADVSPFVGVVA